MHNIIISCICHLENMGSLSYADFPNVSTFLSTGSANHICYIASNLSEKHWEAVQITGAGASFLKYCAILKLLSWSLITNVVSSFPCHDRLPSFNFWESVCQILQCVTIVSLSFFQVRWHSMKRVAASPAARSQRCFWDTLCCGVRCPCFMGGGRVGTVWKVKI